MALKKTIIAFLGIILCFTSNLSCASTGEQRVERLLARTHALEQELASLRDEIKSMHAPKANKSAKSKQVSTASKPVFIDTTVESVHPRDLQPGDKQTIVSAGRSLIYFAGAPVISSPYIGERTAFENNDLISRISNIHLDKRLLEQRQKLARVMAEVGVPFPDHPIIEVSGKVVGLLGRAQGFGNTVVNLADVVAAEVDFAAEINPFITGYVALVYNNMPPGIATGNTVVNRRLYIQQAMMTFGNFDNSSFYFTVAQGFAPFGKFSSDMVSDPFTLTLGRVWTRYAQLGFKAPGDEGIYAAVYGFRPQTGSGTGRFAGGFDLGYAIDHNGLTGDIGVSMISSLPEAMGLQFTGIGAFPGFGAAAATQMLVHQVPGINARAKLSYGNWGILFDYLAATRAFHPADLSFGSPIRGAKPRVYVVEGNYGFNIKDYSATFALGYSHSEQALAIGLPEHRFQAAMAISLWRDTLQAIEYRHEVDYAAGTFACGRTGPATCGVVPATGGSSDYVGLLLAVYF